MYQNIFDTHAHYDDERFDGDRELLLDALPAKGVVAVVNAASDMKTSASGLALAHAYDYFYCAAGVHPHEAGSFAPGDLDAIAGWRAATPEVVAVGEIGLDYHYDFSPARRAAAGLRGAARAGQRPRFAGHHPRPGGARRHPRATEEIPPQGDPALLLGQRGDGGGDFEARHVSRVRRGGHLQKREKARRGGRRRCRSTGCSSRPTAPT